MYIPKFLKRWWQKLMLGGGDSMGKRYDKHTFKLGQLVRISVGNTADKALVDLVTSAAGRYR